MIVQNLKSGKRALVLQETLSTYIVSLQASRTSWRKANVRIEYDYRAFQVAMRLFAGSVSARIIGLNGCIDDIAYLSKYVPVVLEVERELDAQLAAGRDDWSKVFDYDVVLEAGAWLAKNPDVWLDDFRAKVRELIA